MQLYYFFFSPATPDQKAVGCNVCFQTPVYVSVPFRWMFVCLIFIFHGCTNVMFRAFGGVRLRFTFACSTRITRKCSISHNWNSSAFGHSVFMQGDNGPTLMSVHIESRIISVPNTVYLLYILFNKHIFCLGLSNTITWFGVHLHRLFYPRFLRWWICFDDGTCVGMSVEWDIATITLMRRKMRIHPPAAESEESHNHMVMDKVVTFNNRNKCYTRQFYLFWIWFKDTFIYFVKIKSVAIRAQPISFQSLHPLLKECAFGRHLYPLRLWQFVGWMWNGNMKKFPFFDNTNYGVADDPDSDRWAICLRQGYTFISLDLKFDLIMVELTSLASASGWNILPKSD